MLGQAKKYVGGDSFLYFMNYHSSNRSIYRCSSVNKHSIPLQWHLVRNLQGSIVGGLHQSGCTCRLVVVLKEHSLERPLRPGIKASRQMLPPPSLSVKKVYRIMLNQGRSPSHILHQSMELWFWLSRERLLKLS